MLLCTVFSETDSDLELKGVYTDWLVNLCDHPGECASQAGITNTYLGVQLSMVPGSQNSSHTSNSVLAAVSLSLSLSA